MKTAFFKAPEGVFGFTLEFRDEADRVVKRIEVGMAQGKLVWSLDRY